MQHIERMKEMRETNLTKLESRRMKRETLVVWLGLAMLAMLTLISAGRLLMEYRQLGSSGGGAGVGSHVADSANYIGEEDGSGYWAIMLDNGQEYYGKIVNENSDVFVLEDVYYLEVGRRFQTDSERGNVKLIKHGSEVHGPTNRLELYKKHVLQVEELSKDSKVVEAIK